MKKIVYLFIILLFVVGCHKHSKPQATAEDEEILKQAEEGTAVMEELDETEKGFWAK